MAIQLVDRTWCVTTEDYRYSYIVDSAEDVKNLPQCCAGSVAIVADKGGAVYMVNASGEWKEQ